MKSIKRFVLKQSDVVVVNSKQAKQACIDIYKRDYVQLATGYPASVFRVSKTRKLPTKSIRLVSVGRFVELKGFMFIIKAVEELVQLGYSIRLVLVGDGPQKNEITDYIRKNKLSKYIEVKPWVPKKGNVTVLVQDLMFFRNITSVIQKVPAWKI